MKKGQVEAMIGVLGFARQCPPFPCLLRPSAPFLPHWVEMPRLPNIGDLYNVVLQPLFPDLTSDAPRLIFPIHEESCNYTTVLRIYQPPKTPSDYRLMSVVPRLGLD